MKIRIKDNSIRLRLTKTDVADLKNKSIVSCKTVISEAVIFEYVLKTDANSHVISASFANQKITIILPFAEAKTLTDTNEITVKGRQDNGEKDGLYLLIEKDLQCLDETEESQGDMYENPKTVC